MNNFSQNNQQNQQNLTGQQNKGLFSLPPSIMNVVPWMPLMLEMMTGQKIPQMSGTIGEIQQGIQTIQMGLTQVIQHQQNLEQRLIALETKLSETQNQAVQQFSSLGQQVQSIKSIRLTHDRERKQIEFNNRSDFDKSQNYTQKE